MTRFSSPAAERNKEPIADVLRGVLPDTGKVLEIASGSGEHALYFARNFPQLLWQPSDADASARGSIAAWQDHADLPNLLPPIEIDASAPDTWPPVDAVSAILCINMVHISPWEATQGLLAGAQQLLGVHEPLILYGPYVQDGVETAPSNLAFDADLKRRNPAWGLRRLEDVTALAAEHDFRLEDVHALPANNIAIIYRRNAA